MIRILYNKNDGFGNNEYDKLGIGIGMDNGLIIFERNIDRQRGIEHQRIKINIANNQTI